MLQAPPLVLLDGRSGIYHITHESSGKKYIGSAINLKKRFKWHVSRLRNNKHSNPKLQRAWNKYGEDSFSFGLLDYCDKDELLLWEQGWIDGSRPFYNINPLATSRLGLKATEETKRRLVASHKGKVPWNKGKRTGHIPWNRGVKGKQPWNKGLSWDEETRKRVSSTCRAKGIKPPSSLGRVLSEDHKHKIAEKSRLQASQCKLSEEQEHNIIRLYAAGGITQRALASQFGVAQAVITRIIHGRYRKTTPRPSQS